MKETTTSTHKYRIHYYGTIFNFLYQNYKNYQNNKNENQDLNFMFS
jgi:hypothetical protein